MKTFPALFSVAALLLTITPLNSAGQERLLWTNSDAGRIRISDGGRGGIPVVFVHGLGGNWRQWSRQLSYLRSMRRAIAFDVRGHGESAQPEDTDYSTAGALRDLEAVVQQLNLAQIILVGHDFSAAVIADYVRAHPGRVRGILFVDPIGDMRALRSQMDILAEMLDSDSFQQTAQMYYEGILTNASQTTRDAVIDGLEHTSQKAIAGRFKSILDFDPVVTLSDFSNPMLSINSDFNNFPFSLHNILSNLPTESIQGTSHWIQMDRPDWFNNMLDGFLRSL